MVVIEQDELCDRLHCVATPGNSQPFTQALLDSKPLKVRLVLGQRLLERLEFHAVLVHVVDQRVLAGEVDLARPVHGPVDLGQQEDVRHADCVVDAELAGLQGGQRAVEGWTCQPGGVGGG